MRLFAAVLFSSACLAQTFTQRGFFDTRVFLYPETAPNDSGHAVSESLLRYEPGWKPAPWLRLNASLDGRFDSHQQVERSLRLDWWDRSARRPALSVRRLSATVNKGPLTLEVGKQFIRWGKTDILNPTDRFAPKDFLNVANNDFLAVWAARATFEAKSDTIDLVWQPRFSPSRTPLLNQRWTVLPETPGFDLRLRDAGALFPGGSEFGARWNRTAAGYEYSFSFYDGHNHLPLFNAALEPSGVVATQRYYPQMRMYGADAAVPLRWLTLKGEAGYFTSSTKTADEYFDYVVQLERQSGEWTFAGGYAGEYVTRGRSQVRFAPDRGLTKAMLAHVQYTIDTNRAVSADTAVRQNGDGVWIRGEYTQAFGQHWRATAGLTWIHGEPSDFLGQYHRNTYVLLGLRYSF